MAHLLRRAPAPNIGCRALRFVTLILSGSLLAGCLPLDYGASASAFGGVSTAKHSTSGEAGGGVSGHLYPQGSRGLAITADVEGASATAAVVRAGVGLGYAHVLAPFESRWGYGATARAGLGNVPGGGPLATHEGGRFKLLYRPWQTDTVWHQDIAPTCPLWYVAPFVTVDRTNGTDRSAPWVDAVVGVGVEAVHYDLGAP